MTRKIVQNTQIFSLININYQYYNNNQYIKHIINNITFKLNEPN